MSATALTALTLLVGLFGGLVYWWGERSSFPWMKFGAAALIVLGIGLAVATWPDHHVTPPASADQVGSALQAAPSLSPSTMGPTGLGSSLARSTQVSGQVATSDSAPTDSSTPVIIWTPGTIPPPPPSPTPKQSSPGHTPTPTPTTPSPSPSPTDPSPSPTDPSPSPTDPSPSPTDPSPSPTDPSPSPTDPSPSPTDPSPSPTDPSPSPTDPSPSPTELPAPGPLPSPWFRAL